MPPARKRSGASRSAAAAAQGNPASEVAPAASSHKDTVHWSTLAGAAIRLDCQLTGYDADIIRAVAKPEDRPVDAMRRLIVAAAQIDDMIRRSQRREATLLAQLASQAASLQVLSESYKLMSASHAAMTEHLKAVTAYQQRTAQAAATVRDDVAASRELLNETIAANAADFARAIEAHSQIIAIANRFNEGVSYLNELVDAFSDLASAPSRSASSAIDSVQFPVPDALSR